MSIFGEEQRALLLGALRTLHSLSTFRLLIDHHTTSNDIVLVKARSKRCLYFARMVHIAIIAYGKTERVVRSTNGIIQRIIVGDQPNTDVYVVIVLLNGGFKVVGAVDELVGVVDGWDSRESMG